MSVVGNPILMGGGKVAIVAAFNGINTGSNKLPPWNGNAITDKNYFEFTDNDERPFTCKKAGTYYVELYAKGTGSYNATAYLHKNGTQVGTTGATSSGGLARTVITVTLAVNDYIQCLVQRASGSGSVFAGMTVFTADAYALRST